MSNARKEEFAAQIDAALAAADTRAKVRFAIGQIIVRVSSGADLLGSFVPYSRSLFLSLQAGELGAAVEDLLALVKKTRAVSAAYEGPGEGCEKSCLL